MFRSQIQPAEIGRRLERAMEARPLVSVDGTIVPNEYRVHLNPEDGATFKEIETPLCQSFEQWLGEIAAERGYRFMGPVRVQIVQDPQVGRRDVQVQTALEAPGGSQRPAAGGVPPYPAPQRQRDYSPPTGYRAAEERTSLAPPQPARPRMVAPVAGVPAPHAPSGPLPQGVVAHFSRAARPARLAGPSRCASRTFLSVARSITMSCWKATMSRAIMCASNRPAPCCA